MNYYHDEPYDWETCEFNARYVYTEDMIVAEHRSLYEEAVCLETIDENIAREMIIEDWVICQWASPTDMPAGVYVSRSRRPQHDSGWYPGHEE